MLTSFFEQCLSTMRDDQFRFICLSGSEIPNWFSHQRIGSSISFHVPLVSNGRILRLLICAVYAYNGEANGEANVLSACNVIVDNKTRGYQHCLWPTLIYFPEIGENNVFVYLTPLIRKGKMESGDEIKLSIELSKGGEVSKCGIRLIVDEPNVMEECGSVVQYLDSDTAKDDAGHGISLHAHPQLQIRGNQHTLIKHQARANESRSSMTFEMFHDGHDDGVRLFMWLSSRNLMKKRRKKLE
jgi:hypothetical protein